MIRILQQDNRIVKAVFAVIIGVVVVFMVISLVPGILDNGTTSNPSVYATVRTPGWWGRLGLNSKAVSTEQVQRAAEAQMQQRGLPAQFISYFLPQAGQAMIERAVLQQEAEKLGLTVSDDDLRRELKDGPLGQYFFPNGEFIGDDKYVDFVEQNFRRSVQDFENEVKSDMELQRLEALETGGITVSDNAVRDAFLKDGTKVKFDYAIIQGADVQKSINPSEADLETFFKQNAPRYATAMPETRKISFFNFDASAMKDKPAVSDAEIQAYYQAHMQQYKVEAQVQTRHILINSPKGGDPKADAVAKAKAEDVLRQVKAGGNFGELAKKYSEDPGSKDNGGEYPMTPTAKYVPEYSNAALALNPGQTSDLVRTQFGYHIIQTIAKIPAHTKTLAEVKDEISALLLQQKTGAAQQTFAQQLADEAKKNGLQKTADAHGLHVQTTDFIGRDGTIGSLADSTQVVSKAFTMDKNGAPATASVGDGYAVFQVVDVKAAHMPDFASYKAKVLFDYREQKAPELLNEQTKKLADRAKILGDLKKAAAEMKVSLKTSDMVGRDAPVPDLGSMTGPAAVAFTMNKGDISGPLMGANGIVLQVVDKQQPSADEIAKSLPATRDKLVNQQRQEFFSVYAENLMAQYQKAGAIVMPTKKTSSPLGRK